MFARFLPGLSIGEGNNSKKVRDFVPNYCFCFRSYQAAADIGFAALDCAQFTVGHHGS